jgi:hypothetical protein
MRITSTARFQLQRDGGSTVTAARETKGLMGAQINCETIAASAAGSMDGGMAESLQWLARNH